MFTSKQFNEISKALLPDRMGDKVEREAALVTLNRFKDVLVVKKERESPLQKTDRWIGPRQSTKRRQNGKLSEKAAKAARARPGKLPR